MINRLWVWSEQGSIHREVWTKIGIWAVGISILFTIIGTVFYLASLWEWGFPVLVGIVFIVIIILLTYARVSDARYEHERYKERQAMDFVRNYRGESELPLPSDPSV